LCCFIRYHIWSKIQSIGSEAFCDTAFETITIPNSVLSIGENAFQYCSNLKTISFGDNLSTIGDGIFNQCPNLTEIAISENNPFFLCDNGVLFSHDKTRLIFYPVSKTDASYQIPNGVKQVADYAFYGCNNLVSVTFPDSVTIIGENMFENCTNLNSIVLSDNIEILPNYIFYNCTNLTDVTLPANLKYIDFFSFSNCESLTSIVLPDSVISIWEGLFTDCTALKNVKLPEGLTSIPRNMFENCPALESIMIPESVTKIDSLAFYNCTGLTEITLPKGLVEIVSAFDTCTNLSKVIIWENATDIDEDAFFGCTKVKIYGKLGSYANSYATRKHIPFTGINDPINDFAVSTLERTRAVFSFTPPKDATNVVLQQSQDFGTTWTNAAVTNVLNASSASAEVTGLQPGTIYHFRLNVTGGVFAGMSNVLCVTPPTSNPPEDFTFDPLTGTITKYIGTNTTVEIPSSVNSVKVTKIGRYAFFENNQVTSVIIPNTVTDIEECAFNYCTNLTSVTLGNSVQLIDQWAFVGCEGITELTLPDSLITIYDNSFVSCSGLTELTIPKNVSYIGQGAFSGCIRLTAINVNPENQSYCSDNGILFDMSKTIILFYPTTKTERVYIIPDSVIEIGKSVFSYCTQLQQVEIPDSVCKIGAAAFINCSSLTSIALPDGLVTLDMDAFKGCGGLTSITIPNNVTNIGVGAFSYCKNLIRADIPPHTFIDFWSFSDCPATFKIYSTENSYAHTYATENNLLFEAIPEHSGITDLAYMKSAYNKVTLTFSPATGATDVQLQYSQDYGDNWVTATTYDTLNASSISATAINLLPDTNYLFRLVITGGDREGTSNTVEARTTKLLTYLGDANGDQRITVYDAVVVLQLVAGVSSPDDKQCLTADVNSDGSITAFDVVLLLQYVAGTETGYSIGSILSQPYQAGDPIVIPQASVTEWGSSMENGYLIYIPVLSCYYNPYLAPIPVKVENNTPVTNYISENNNYDFSAYQDRICTYSVDSGGIYSIKKVIDDSITGTIAQTRMTTTNTTAQFGISKGFDGTPANIKITKITGTTYQFQNSDGSLADFLPNDTLYVAIKDFTRIIVKSKDEYGETIFKEYSANVLPNFNNAFTKLECILVNNPSSVRTEYLSVLYGEVDGVLDTPDVLTTNLRIVKTNGTIDIDSSGVFHYYYDVYNPFIGAIESNIPGLKGATNASSLSNAATIGKFYKFVDGVLQDKDAPALDGKSIFPSSGSFTRTAATPTPDNLSVIASYSNNELKLKGDNTVYKTDSDTTVIMIEAGNIGKNDFKWGTATQKSLTDLGSDSVFLRNYCVITNPDTSRITTTYADQIEAFVVIDAAKSTEAYQVVDFVVILRDKVASLDLLNHSVVSVG